MPSEPRYAEALCERCWGSGADPQVGTGTTHGTFRPAPCSVAYGGCGGLGWQNRTLTEDSLTARMLDLAEAVLARDDYKRSTQNRHMSRLTLDEHDKAIAAALAAVRAHPGYRATCPRCGKILDPAVNGVHTCTPRSPE